MCGHVVCQNCQNPRRMPVKGSVNPKVVCQACVGGADQIDNPPPIDCHPQQPVQDAPASGLVASEVEAPRCRECGESLRGDYVDLGDLGRVHPSCFVCCIDGKIIDDQYVDVEGELFCEQHYVEFHCNICEGCSQRIHQEEEVRALGEYWHARCFTCTRCAVQLTSGSEFNFYTHSGSAYCQNCYLDHLADRCAGCGFPIQKKYIDSMDKRWHDECFVCYKCSTPFMLMEDRTVTVVDGRPFCAKDAAHICALSEEDRRLWLNSEDEERLSTAATQTCLPAMDGAGGVSLSPEDWGACLSLGIAESVKADTAFHIPQPSGDLILYDFKSRMQATLAHIRASAPAVHFDVEVFAPLAFRKIRRHFGITEEEFWRSINLRPLSGGAKGEGKSGQLFFFSWDQRYIVKTIDNGEMLFFMKCLKDYHSYICNDGTGNSLLPRYLGNYAMKLEGVPVVRFIVMANAFPRDVVFREQYDLKGVLGAARYVSDEDRRKGVKVLKDRNFFEQHMAVGPAMKEKLSEQFRRDVCFLQERNRIDYSLLLGITSVDQVPQWAPRKKTEGRWATPEHGGLPSVDADGGPAGDVYFMSIIDALQEYRVKKALESHIRRAKHKLTHIGKKSEHCNVDNAYSAVSAELYAKRFLNYIELKME